MLLPLDVLSLLFLSLSASRLALVPQASAALVNVTVDDTYGDPLTGNQIVYEPQGRWEPGQSCNNCTAHPDKSMAFNRTWHESSFNDVGLPDALNQLPKATFSFVGVAVYLFCIVTESFLSPFGNSDMTFLIDNVLVGTFQQPPTGDPNYFYNVPVYVNESLSPGQHTITIVNGEINGNGSLTLLDYIVYTPVDNSTDNGALPSPTPPASMTGADISGLSSSRRTVIIAVVASLGGVLLLVALIAAIIYLGRRRARANTQPGSQNGVIALHAAPIDQEDPDTSGWVEGTWVGDDDAGQNGARRAPSNGRRKRGPSNASATSLPTTPSTRSLNKPLPLSPVSNIRTRLPYSRVEPLSPSSSFGNLGSAPPDSATFFIPPCPVPPMPPLPPSAAALAPVRPQRPLADSDTFLDMGRSSFIDPSPPTRPSHPFATAQAYSSSSSSIQTRQRSDTNQSVTIPPPSASSTALAAATRGYAYATTTGGPTRKRSDSDLERERRQQQQQQQQNYPRTNPNTPSRQRSGSDLSNSAYARATPASGSRRRAGSDLEVNYPRGGALVNPLAPTVPLTVTRQRSGSDLEKGGYADAYSGMQSPSTFVSTLPSTVTTPTSMTALMPKAPRNSGSQGQMKQRRDGEKERERPSPARATPPRSRKVDPIDPSLQPSRDPPARQGSQSRSRGPEEEPQSSSSSRSGRRGGIVMSDRDRERFGFLDVPQDANLRLSLDSRPPSYHEAGH